MRARKLILIAAVVVAAVAAAGAAVVRWKVDRSFSTPSPPRLVIADSRDHFGTVWLTNNFAWAIPIRNEDSVPIQVESIGLSCSCVRIVPESFTVQPGEQVTAQLVIDLTAKQRGGEEATFELFPVVRRGDGEPEKLHWRIRGRVRQFLVLDRPASFGRTSVIAPAQPVEVDFSTCEPIRQGFDVSVSLPHFTAVVTTDSHRPTQHHLRVIHTGPRVLSDFSVDVRLTPVGSESQSLPATTIPITGQIVPDVEPVPVSLLAGGVTVGQTTTCSVSLASISGSRFEVLGYEAKGEGLSVTAEGGEYRVTQRAIRTGEQSGQVIFRVRTAGGESVALLRVSYLGINP